MDNRLTKRRLSDFLSYEWIMIIVVIIAAIILWELVYTMTAVKLTSGQQFKYYYDQNMSSLNDSEFYSIITDNDDPTFSYDVLSIGSEALSSEYNVLNVRLSVYEGDVIFTDSVEEENGASRAKSIIDSERVYVMGDLLTDGVNYLAKFLKDEFKDVSDVKSAVFDYGNLDENKIRANFLERMKKDNRFRSDAQKEEGFSLECERIKKVCAELEKFDYLMSVGEEKGLFYRYTKYSQSFKESQDNADLQAALDNEISEGRENAVYGINLEKLTGGKRSVAEYFRRADKTDAVGAVLLAFDFYDVADAKLTDLQFETVSFINKIVDEFSDIYSSRQGEA